MTFCFTLCGFSCFDLLQSLTGVDLEIHCYILRRHISVCSFVVDADPFGITVIYYIHYIALGKKSQNSGLLIRLGSHTKSLRVDLCDHSAHIIGQCLRIIPEQEIFVFGPADQRTGLDLGPTVPAL